LIHSLQSDLFLILGQCIACQADPTSCILALGAISCVSCRSLKLPCRFPKADTHFAPEIDISPSSGPAKTLSELYSRLDGHLERNRLMIEGCTGATADAKMLSENFAAQRETMANQERMVALLLARGFWPTDRRTCQLLPEARMWQEQLVADVTEAEIDDASDLHEALCSMYGKKVRF